jgi:predicted nucleic acid-binding protein
MATKPARREVVYADTSFLFSLYLRDANTTGATAYVAQQAPALVLTSWQRCELRNAIRLAVARGNTTPELARQALADIEADTAAGDLVATALVWPDLYETAENLSETDTAKLGVRTLDLLHVAAALNLSATAFLSFDARQFALAMAAGLNFVRP